MVIGKREGKRGRCCGQWPGRKEELGLYRVERLLYSGATEIRTTPAALPWDRCVAEFDHHCPVVGNCIGVGNRREFFGYLVTLLLGELLWWSLALQFFKR